MEETKELKEPLKNWMETPYKRAPWIKENVHYAEAVAAPNDQKSNNDLADSEVLQKRDEAIGTSYAPPLNALQDPAPVESGGQKAPAV